jgi:hypothetical protein
LSEKALGLFALSTCMLVEFRRYSTLQRDQAPLAALLVYLKRNGGWVQLNRIWKELGPTGGGPFWNQTTLINKLDKLERLGIVAMERRILPSPRSEAKKKTNTFYRLNSASPLYPHVYGMLKIYREEPDRYSSELVEKPLDRLIELAGNASEGDPMVGQELEVAMEMIGEVFGVGGAEVKRMIKERMTRKGLIRGRKPVSGAKCESKGETGKTAPKRRRRSQRKETPEPGRDVLE